MKASMMKRFALLIGAVALAQCLNTQAMEKEEIFKLESGLYLREYETNVNGKIEKDMGRIKLEVNAKDITIYFPGNIPEFKGEIKGNKLTPFNLRSAPLSYDDQHYSHSRQFRSNIVAEWQYWSKVIADAYLPHIK